MLLSPVYLIIGVMVRVYLGQPVLFRHTRTGKRGRSFTLYKFRSMTEDRDPAGTLLPDDKRLTRFGRMLRATGLDELPEFFNVLTGDMSLVGPRPLVPKYLARYSAEQARRHDVTPGITGWAQVNGRNALPWPDRFELDVWYVDHHTLWLHALILWKTVGTVLSRRGIAHEGVATMHAFQGNPPNPGSNRTTDTLVTPSAARFRGMP